jgi:periplasmic mercuric ion binding protein
MPKRHYTPFNFIFTFNTFKIMKTLLMIIAFILPSITFGLFASEKTEFKVYGACGMCEARIEKAAKSVDGVSSADWNPETKMLSITYDSAKANLDDVHKNIAEAGHDTDKVKAKDATCQALPACCHYDRKADDKTGQLLKTSGSCCTQ